MGATDPPTFRTMTASDGAAVIAMMTALYVEDASGYVSPEHFRRTVDTLLAEPHRGTIVVFDLPGSPCIGYAILIPYWSNEFGGAVAEVDELFVRAEFRSRGIGRAFIAWIERERPHGATAIELEVTPGNHKAHEFYTAVGFAKRPNVLQVKRLASYSNSVVLFRGPSKFKCNLAHRRVRYLSRSLAQRLGPSG